MSSTPPRPDPSSPRSIAQARFAIARKGYRTDDVSTFLVAVAAEIERLQERNRQLEASLNTQVSASEPVRLDEDIVTRMLGDETVRVLQAARESAAEIRQRAQENAERLVSEATDHANHLRHEAEVDSARRRQDAEAEAEAEIAQAKQEGRAMVEEARAYRERVLEDLERRTVLARQQVADLLHGRDRLLQVFERARLVAIDVTSGLQDVDLPDEVVNLAPTTGPVPMMVAAPTTGDDTLDDAAADDDTRHDDADDADDDGALGVDTADDATAPDDVTTELAGLAAASTPADIAEDATDAEDAPDDATATLDALTVDGVTDAEDAPDDATATLDALTAVDVTDAEDAPDDATATLDALTADDPPETVTPAAPDDPTTELATAPTDAPTNVVSLFRAGPATEADGADDGTEADDADDGTEADGADDGTEADEVDDGTVADDATETDDAGDTADRAGGEGAPPGRAGSDVGGLFARLRGDLAAAPPTDGGGDADQVADPDDPDDADRPEDVESVEDVDSVDDAGVEDVVGDGAATGSLDGADVDDADLDDGAADRPFARRDEILTPLIVAAARKLKRVLADEQNEVLDALRRAAPGDALHELLPSPGEYASSYLEVLADELEDAAIAGAVDVGGSGRRPPARVLDAARDQLTNHLTDPLRQRLERSIADGADPDDAARAVRAVYREWKVQHIDAELDDVFRAAFGHGLANAIPAGTVVAWTVDPSATPCPDCEDNSLATGVLAGEPFPTGHTAAPAHPGCRCLTLPIGQ